MFLPGDFKAYVGTNRESWPNCVGRHSVRKMNENGQWLLEICTQNEHCITNIIFKEKHHHEVSWCHPALITGTNSIYSLLEQRTCLVLSALERFTVHVATSTTHSSWARWSNSHVRYVRPNRKGTASYQHLQSRGWNAHPSALNSRPSKECQKAEKSLKMPIYGHSITCLQKTKA